MGKSSKNKVDGSKDIDQKRNTKTKIKTSVVKLSKELIKEQSLNKMNNLNKKFTCQICRQIFESQKKLLQHFLHHSKSVSKYDKPTKCDSCPMIFTSQTKAIQHKHKAHPNVPNSFCQHCGKLFVLMNSLEEHLSKDHANEISLTSLTTIKCDHCPATFSNFQALEYHTKSMHNQIKYLLAIDLYIPPSSTKIIKSNSSELFSAYYCYLCGVEYMIKNGLKKHLYDLHTPEERNKKPDNFIKCKTCEAMFYTKFAYEKHLIFHKPGDLYAENQQERVRIVSRVDQDFDIGRVPLLQELNTMLKQITENSTVLNEKQIEDSINGCVSFSENPKIKIEQEIIADPSINVVEDITNPTKIENKKTIDHTINSDSLEINQMKPGDDCMKFDSDSVNLQSIVIKTEKIEDDSSTCDFSNTGILQSSFSENDSTISKEPNNCIDIPNTCANKLDVKKQALYIETNNSLKIVNSKNEVIVLKKVAKTKKVKIKSGDQTVTNQLKRKNISSQVNQDICKDKETELEKPKIMLNNKKNKFEVKDSALDFPSTSKNTEEDSVKLKAIKKTESIKEPKLLKKSKIQIKKENMGVTHNLSDKARMKNQNKFAIKIPAIERTLFNNSNDSIQILDSEEKVIVLKKVVRKNKLLKVNKSEDKNTIKNFKKKIVTSHESQDLDIKQETLLQETNKMSNQVKTEKKIKDYSGISKSTSNITEVDGEVTKISKCNNISDQPNCSKNLENSKSSKSNNISDQPNCSKNFENAKTSKSNSISEKAPTIKRIKLENVDLKSKLSCEDNSINISKETNATINIQNDSATKITTSKLVFNKISKDTIEIVNSENKVVVLKKVAKSKFKLNKPNIKSSANQFKRTNVVSHNDESTQN